MPSRRPRIFYGWYIVFGLTLISVAMSAMSGGPSFALFVEPMSKDLGIGKAYFGWATGVRTLAMGISAPLVGKLMDRFGARILLVGGGVIAGLLMLAMGAISAGWHLVVIFALTGLLGFQAGPSALLTSVPLAKWFVRNRGRAMALAFTGTPIGILIWAPTTQIFIGRFGWRDTWLLLAVLAAVPIVLIALLVIRRQPEDMGLLPDGDEPAQAVAGTTGPDSRALPGKDVATADYPWTRSAAVRTPAFWALSLVFGLMMFSTSALVLFRTPYFIEIGIQPRLAAFGLALEAVPALLVGFLLSFVMDKLSYRLVAGFGFLLLALSVLATMGVSTAWHAFVAHALFGFGIAMVIVMQSVIWPLFFGRANLGVIRGISTPVTLVFGALGAPMAGMVKDNTGGYFPAWWIAVGGLLVCMVVVALLPRPRPRDASAIPGASAVA
jgi:sugar phosphate permease